MVFKFIKQLLTASFHNLKDIFKAFGTAIIGVRYFPVSRIGIKIAHAADHLLLITVGNLANIFEIFVIHG